MSYLKFCEAMSAALVAVLVEVQVGVDIVVATGESYSLTVA